MQLFSFSLLISSYAELTAYVLGYALDILTITGREPFSILSISMTVTVTFFVHKLFIICRHHISHLRFDIATTYLQLSTKLYSM